LQEEAAGDRENPTTGVSDRRLRCNEASPKDEPTDGTNESQKRLELAISRRYDYK
jgi:hypothetical protein